MYVAGDHGGVMIVIFVTSDDGGGDDELAWALGIGHDDGHGNQDSD